MELYKKYRPNTLTHLHGQESAVKVLLGMINSKNIPHALLLSGASGCGKTTTARIFREVLNCRESDFAEINAADFRGVDKVREIRAQMSLSVLSGGSRIYLLDECQNLSKDAQTALLKMLEDTPKHVYFILCTTEPGKLLPTIRTRCTQVNFVPLSRKHLLNLIQEVCKKEKFDLGEEARDKIVELSEGSARKALVLLDSILSVKDHDEQLDAVQKTDTAKDAVEIARLLLNPQGSWAMMAKLLKAIEEPEEGIRRLILAFMANTLLGEGKPDTKKRAYLAIQVFRDHWYDMGRPGLVASCYEMYHTK